MEAFLFVVGVPTIAYAGCQLLSTCVDRVVERADIELNSTFRVRVLWRHCMSLIEALHDVHHVRACSVRQVELKVRMLLQGAVSLTNGVQQTDTQALTEAVTVSEASF